MTLRSLQLIDFKSFRDTQIPFGPFTLLVGANASGKSNVQDALRFLHGCAQGFTVAEVMDEKWGPGGLLLWRGIRGGAREVARGGSDHFELIVETELPQRRKYELIVGFREKAIAQEVLYESLSVGDKFVFRSTGGTGIARCTSQSRR